MALLLELRREYLNMLIGHISIPIYQGIASIYDAACRHKKNTSINSEELRIFQDLLKNVIPKWSPAVLTKEVNRIRMATKMGMTLDAIYTAVMRSTILLLSGADNVESLKHVPRECYDKPLFDGYIHRCYVLCAREFYNFPFVFSKHGDPRSLKDNQQDAIRMIRQCAQDALGHSVPLKEVLAEFLIGGDAAATEKDDEPVVIPPVPFHNTISLLASDGSNVMDKVFSTYNIRESIPSLEGGAAAASSPTIDKHSISNFLMNDPLLHSETLINTQEEEE